MKTSLLAKSVFALSMVVTTTVAFAGENSVDASRDVFVNHTILGNWVADASSVSNDKPDADKSLAVFGRTVLGKTERVENASGKVSNTDVAASVFTHSYQN